MLGCRAWIAGLAITGLLGASCSTPLTSATRATSPTPVASQAVPKSMDFALKPYVWMTGMNGNVEIGRAGGDVDASFDDVLDSLDFGAMAALEMKPRGSPWGYRFDYIYLAFDKDGSNGVEVDAWQNLFEADVTYRPAGQDCFDMLFGLRYNSLEVEFDLPNGSSVHASEGWVDPVVGALATLPFLDWFALDLRADVGGFGIGSNYTAQLQAEVVWNPVQWFGASAGWRYLKVDYDDDELEYRVATTGPIVGVEFRF